MINIAVLGYGTVGSGVFEVINTNRDIINNNAGEEINIKYVLDLRDFPGDPVEKVLVHDADVILNDPEVRVVVEVMGGVEPAYTFVKKALMAGKSVCTSNKELVAEHGTQLLKTASENGVNFFFEASCGGGIPIIRPLCTSLTADRIEEISGILNGTTNYILTKMETEGWDFDKALKSAQDNGFAERNPEADIEGYDACRKIAILSSLAYGKTIRFEDIYTEGISRITHRDIEYAGKLGCAVKLIASCAYLGEEEGYCAFVAPVMIKKEHPLFPVNGVFNAVFVEGNMLGPAMFYGSGAGKLPTASAVVGDVVEAVRNLGRTLPVAWSDEKLKLSEIGNIVRRFYVRMEGALEERLSAIEKLFGRVNVCRMEDETPDFCFITEAMAEKTFDEAYSKLEGALGRIRVDNLSV
ncbi:MAG TPA: homoserine dehydrogenase [Lachnospiraceae bacterium]|nr:homoserine dehydrogenase [Lachnospiraceae bacterium]